MSSSLSLQLQPPTVAMAIITTTIITITSITTTFTIMITAKLMPWAMSRLSYLLKLGYASS